MDVDLLSDELALMKRELRRLKFQADGSTKRIVVVLERLVEKLQKRVNKLKAGL